MRGYASIWLLSTAAVSGFAALTLVTTAGWGPTIVIVAAVAVLAGVLSYSWREAFGTANLSVPGWTVGSSAGAVMFLGLPLAAGRSAFLVFAALGATCPPLVRRLRRRLAADTEDAVPRAPVHAPQVDPLLTHAWLDTTFRLRAAPTPEDALAVVQERALLLDELEQHDPHAFQEWLTSMRV